jgi:hypothetical protein
MKSKKDAIVEWVAHEFNAIPREWVHIMLEHEHQCEPLPMWALQAVGKFPRDVRQRRRA